MTSSLSSSSSSSSSATSADFHDSAEPARKKAFICSPCIELINNSVVKILCGEMEKNISSQSDQPSQLCTVCEKSVNKQDPVDEQDLVEDPIVTIFKAIFVDDSHKLKTKSPNSPREEKAEEPASSKK